MHQKAFEFKKFKNKVTIKEALTLYSALVENVDQNKRLLMVNESTKDDVVKKFATNIINGVYPGNHVIRILKNMNNAFFKAFWLTPEGNLCMKQIASIILPEYSNNNILSTNERKAIFTAKFVDGSLIDFPRKANARNNNNNNIDHLGLIINKFKANTIVLDRNIKDLLPLFVDWNDGTALDENFRDYNLTLDALRQLHPDIIEDEGANLDSDRDVDMDDADKDKDDDIDQKEKAEINHEIWNYLDEVFELPLNHIQHSDDNNFSSILDFTRNDGIYDAKGAFHHLTPDGVHPSDIPCLGDLIDLVKKYKYKLDKEKLKVIVLIIQMYREKM